MEGALVIVHSHAPNISIQRLQMLFQETQQPITIQKGKSLPYILHQAITQSTHLNPNHRHLRQPPTNLHQSLQI